MGLRISSRSERIGGGHYCPHKVWVPAQTCKKCEEEQEATKKAQEEEEKGLMSQIRSDVLFHRSGHGFAALVRLLQLKGIL